MKLKHGFRQVQFKIMGKGIQKNDIVKEVEKGNSLEIQQEIDAIFSLLAYAIVAKDWQPDSIERSKRRGYNIGALLVNENNNPVHYGLNCINSTDNATQHGEVRTIIGYLDKTKRFDLTDFTMYTTLEPCIMCAGMMTMTSIKRIVYGQKDVVYSKAFERLAFDSSSIGGYPPYPRQVEVDVSKTEFREALDMGYQKFLKKDKEKYLAKYLASQEAKDIFEEAKNTFLHYKVIFSSNQEILEKAQLFFNQIHIGNGN